jgi:CRISPR-associated protein Cas2
MTTRRHYLVSYDIASGKEGDKRRSKVFDHLEGRGDHAQFSVFFCQLNERELAQLRSDLTSIIHHTEDQVLLVDLGPAHNPLDGGIECLGKTFDVRSRVIVV